MDARKIAAKGKRDNEVDELLTKNKKLEADLQESEKARTNILTCLEKENSSLKAQLNKLRNECEKILQERNRYENLFFQAKLDMEKYILDNEKIISELKNNNSE
jgi:predicted nuclease with TOPRIM domain